VAGQIDQLETTARTYADRDLVWHKLIAATPNCSFENNSELQTMEGKVPFRSTTAKPTVISFSSEELRWLDDFSQAPKEVRNKLPWRTYMRMYVLESVTDKDSVVDAIVQVIQTTIKEHPATAWIVRNGHTLAHSLDRLPVCGVFSSGYSDESFWTDRVACRIVRLIMQVGNIGNNPAFHNLLDYRVLTWKNPSKLAVKCLNILATNLPVLSFLTWHQPIIQLADSWLNQWMEGVTSLINKMPIRIYDLIAILYSTGKGTGDSFAEMAAEWPEAALLEQDTLRTELWRRILLSKKPAVLGRFETYCVSQNCFRILAHIDTLKSQAARNLRMHIPSSGQTLPNVRITKNRPLSIQELLRAAAAEAQAELDKRGGASEEKKADSDEKKWSNPDHRFQFIPSNLTADPDALEEISPEDAPPQYARLQKDFAEGGITVKLVKLKTCPCLSCRAKTTSQSPTGPTKPEAPKAKDEPASLLKHTSSSTSVSEDTSSSSSSSEEPGLADLAASAIAVAEEQAKE
jgi:hypothetical protein